MLWNAFPPDVGSAMSTTIGKHSSLRLWQKVYDNPGKKKKPASASSWDNGVGIWNLSTGCVQYNTGYSTTTCQIPGDSYCLDRRSGMRRTDSTLLEMADDEVENTPMCSLIMSSLGHKQ